MRRLATWALAAAVIAPPVCAQQTTMVPPAAPTIGASGGFTGGVALPVGSLTKTNSAGYQVGGLVDFSAAEQPYSFRVELGFQQFERKTSADRKLNIWSLGGSILARQPRGQSSAFAQGGIGVYSVHGRGNPGFNLGAGLDVPLLGFVGIAEVRVHWVLTDKPTVTIPITLGARF